MWFHGVLSKCARCERDSELFFRLQLVDGSTFAICPQCASQAVEASIIESELMGLVIPDSPKAFGDAPASVEDAIALAKQELLEHIVELAARAGVPLVGVLLTPGHAEEMGVNVDFLRHAQQA